MRSNGRRSAFARDVDLAEIRRGLLGAAQARLLPAELAQVVEVGAANVAAAHDLELLDLRGVHGVDALDTHAVADLANGEGLAETAALAPDHHTLEDLDALLLAFLDAIVDADLVAGPKRGNVAELGRLDGLNLGNDA